MFSIPARSPDLDPIENLFHLVSRQLGKDVLDMEITSENFEQKKPIQTIRCKNYWNNRINDPLPPTQCCEDGWKEKNYLNFINIGRGGGQGETGAC